MLRWRRFERERCVEHDRMVVPQGCEITWVWAALWQQEGCHKATRPDPEGLGRWQATSTQLSELAAGLSPPRMGSVTSRRLIRTSQTCLAVCIVIDAGGGIAAVATGFGLELQRRVLDAEAVVQILLMWRMKASSPLRSPTTRCAVSAGSVVLSAHTCRS